MFYTQVKTKKNRLYKFQHSTSNSALGKIIWLGIHDFIEKIRFQKRQTGGYSIGDIDFF